MGLTNLKYTDNQLFEHIAVNLILILGIYP